MRKKNKEKKRNLLIVSIIIIICISINMKMIDIVPTKDEGIYIIAIIICLIVSFFVAREVIKLRVFLTVFKEDILKVFLKDCLNINLYTAKEYGKIIDFKESPLYLRRGKAIKRQTVLKNERGTSDNVSIGNYMTYLNYYGKVTLCDVYYESEIEFRKVNKIMKEKNISENKICECDCLDYSIIPYSGKGKRKILIFEGISDIVVGNIISFDRKGIMVKLDINRKGKNDIYFLSKTNFLELRKYVFNEYKYDVNVENYTIKDMYEIKSTAENIYIYEGSLKKIEKIIDKYKFKFDFSLLEDRIYIYIHKEELIDEKYIENENIDLSYFENLYLKIENIQNFLSEMFEALIELQ